MDPRDSDPKEQQTLPAQADEQIEAGSEEENAQEEHAQDAGVDPEAESADDVREEFDEPGQPTNWVGLLVFLNLAILACVVGMIVWFSYSPPWAEEPAPIAAEQWKEVAAVLKDRGFPAIAADALENYLAETPAAPDRAETLFSIGGLRFDAEQYDSAAKAFLLARLEGANQEEMAQKAEAALNVCRRLHGAEGELDLLLAQRQMQGARPPDSPVVAVVGNRQITEADLDVLVDQQVDRALAAQGALEDMARRRAEEARYADPRARAQLLRDFIRTELFRRQARNLNLDQDPGYLLARKQQADALLLRRFLQERASLPPPTDEDLKEYFEENKERYRRPDSLVLIAIRVPDQAAAEAVLAKVKSADDFRKEAERIREADGPAQATATQVFRGRRDQVLGDTEALFSMKEGEWTDTPIEAGSGRFLLLVEKKISAHTPPLQEILPQVRAAFLQARQQAAVDALFDELKEVYAVKLLLKPPASEVEEMVGETGQMLGEAATTADPGEEPAPKRPAPKAPATGKPAPAKTKAEKPGAAKPPAKAESAGPAAKE